jgi:predicted ATPase with chaperone activity
MNARRRQQERFANTVLVANAHMSSKHIDRTLKLALTIADMENNDQVEIKHIAEVLQYRNKNMFIE